MLLHNLAKSIDGSLQFVTDYISYILAYYLIGKDFEQWSPQFGPFDNSCLLQQTPEVIIDAAMTALCTISFTLVMRETAINVLENLIFDKHYWQFMQAEAVLVRG